MNPSVRPELPTAALRSSQPTHAAVDNSAPFTTHPESTYKSGKVVQTNEATSLYPDGQEPIDVFQQVSRNISVAAELGFGYPPLLTHGLLLALGIAGWKSATILVRRLWMFGLILLIPHILVTNFLEVRAQIGTMLCMLPLALQGVLSISESDRAAA